MSYEEFKRQILTELRKRYGEDAIITRRFRKRTASIRRESVSEKRVAPEERCRQSIWKGCIGIIKEEWRWKHL